MKNKLAKLIDVKSIVTLTITAVFAVQTLKGNVSSDQFLTIFTTVIAFYFGTQHAKNKEDK
ncbi:MAG: hypothetical protein NC042_09455 [Ruminococcus flavefaciens]|nr:hypothetical protein [Ruminococcus flavefaciens]